MQYKILLLEDDLQLNQTIKQFLSLKGFNVFSAFDGYEAQDIIYEKPIDLMLLDVKVPNLNGFEFLKELRKNNNTTPAIFITSLNSVDDVEKGFNVGADDYIRKPFALKELLIRVESLLKKRYNSYSQEIKINENLTFDIKNLILTKNGSKVSLKTKELQLLALFLQNQDELITYEKINSTLWSYEEEPSSGSLRTYIKSIRQIIGKDKIETIKNRGYRFVSK